MKRGKENWKGREDEEFELGSGERFKKRGGVLKIEYRSMRRENVLRMSN